MSAGIIEPIEQALAADASVHDVMNLVDQAIESATATGDGATLGLLASFFDRVASERGQQWSWLSMAAERARTLAVQAAATDPEPEPEPEPSPTPAADAPGATEPTPLTAAAYEKERYAGWWRRTVALLVDLVILLMLEMIVGRASGGGDVGSNLLGLAVWGLPVAYFAGMHAFNRGATVGKMLAGVAVLKTDGGRVELGRAIWRSAATLLLWITGIGGLVDMIVGAADGRRQWLHDKVAGTIVVHRHWRAVDPRATLDGSPDEPGLSRIEPDPNSNPDSRGVTLQ
jgi:uncharacterized RDD family membrane protein YckC